MPKAGKLDRYNEAFKVRNEETGESLAGVHYRIEGPEGVLASGITDAEGQTVRVHTSKPTEIKLIIVD